jgi:alpha-tubulin suppressor-like RCC1 family protein
MSVMAFPIFTALVLLFASNARATVSYVDLNSTNAMPPFTDWATAATNIQDAIDAANPGDTILVTNGVYQTGSRLTSDGVENRVVVTNTVTLQSVNGPTVTSIDGGNLVRCIYLTNGVLLAGFTLTHGKGGNGGGVFCASTNELISNCQLINNSAVNGGGACSGTLTNCMLSGNASGNSAGNGGGGAYGSYLNNCTLSGNKTGTGAGSFGAGALACTLNYCTLLNNNANSIYGDGGGACSSTLNYCTLSGNTADFGGGAAYSTLNNCVLSGNSATTGGGSFYGTANNCLYQGNLIGAWRGTLYNCILTANISRGGYQASLINCTVTGTSGTGVSSCSAVNCIVYNNAGNYDAPLYDGPVTFNYSCTTPLPPDGAGNISSDPLFVNFVAGDFHLQTNSPCIEAGNNSYVTVTNDPDGNPRIVGNTVDMGAYEFQTPTFIQVQPQSQTAYGYFSASFNVVAISPLPLSYQWLFNGNQINGATNSNLTLTNLQSADSGNYSVAVSNSFVTVTSSNAVLSVIFPAPNIISVPTNQVVVLGSNAEFSVSAFSPYPMSFQWQWNGTNLLNGGRTGGATNPVFDISSVQLGDAGPYQVVVTNNYGAVTSSIASLTVLADPIILIPPSNIVTMACITTNLSVIVTGAPPLSFQWQKNGINLVDDGAITGSSTPTLIFPSPQTTNTGQYCVIVSNGFGMLSVTNVNVTVVPIVVWGNRAVTPPVDATNIVAIAAGADYLAGDFDVALRGDGTIVEWGPVALVPQDATNIIAISAGEYFGLALRRDGTVVGWGDNAAGEINLPSNLTNVVAISAGFRNSLALLQNGTVIGWGDNSYGDPTPPPNATNIIAIAAGYYDSLALRQDGTIIGWGANWYGEATPPGNATNIVAISAGQLSNLAMSKDGYPIVWGDGQSGEYAIPENATNLVEIAAASGSNLTLRKDGLILGWGFNVFGELSPPSNLTNIMAISAKDYHSLALIEDPTTQIPPIFVQHPSDCAPLTSQTALLLCRPFGSLPLRFQWYFNGASLPEETNSWLALTAIRPGQAGSYQVVVTNNFGSATSHIAVVSELPWATIASQLASQSAVVGSNVTFNIGMYGLPPFYYQWYFNGSPLTDNLHFSGSTTASLIVSNIQIPDGGDYSMIVTNAFNSVTSTLGTLTVLVPAGITSQPTNKSVLLNSNAVFTVSATGTGSLSYQWMSNGTNLSTGGRINGATSPTLTISGSQTNDNDDYQVIVANSYGTATSVVATLTVYVPVQITGQPSSRAVLIGSNASFAVTGAGTALGYQWYFNGTPLADDARIYGSAKASLTISNVQPSDAGGYYAIVTNIFTSATSMIASLTPLSIAAPSVRYVDLNSINPASPYLTWNTAATNIQDAIDAAVDGDQVFVTNGVYKTGGRIVYGSITNRVVVNKVLTVQSVNGATATAIQGNRGVGTNAVRCIYLTNNASLIGFTMTNGASRSTGDVYKELSGSGAWCESTNSILINCYFVSNSSAQFGGGVFSGNCSNCVFNFNSATNGGASFGGILSNCLLGTNSANNGGGACSNTLNACVLLGNKATVSGAGAYGSRLYNCVVGWNTNSSLGGGLNNCVANSCVISNNSATRGGGAYTCVMSNCFVYGNLATDGTGGGGAFQSTLFNCVVTGNRAPVGAGGGGYGCTFNNCLISSNSASSLSGAYNSTLNNCTIVGHTNGYGAYLSTLRNCIIYYNAANTVSGSLVNCCTTPLPAGSGNFTNAPAFVNPAAGDFHLQPVSACINAGNNLYATNSTDLDGNPRIAGGTVDIGAYEFPAPSSMLSYFWAQQYGLPTDGSADFADADGDGLNNWQEWIAGTNPTNAASVLLMGAPSKNVPGLKVSWQSVSGKTYFLQRGTNLAVQPVFTSIKSNIVGQVGTTVYTDTTATNGGPYFYRVGVQ